MHTVLAAAAVLTVPAIVTAHCASSAVTASGTSSGHLAYVTTADGAAERSASHHAALQGTLLGASGYPASFGTLLQLLLGTCDAAAVLGVPHVLRSGAFQPVDAVPAGAVELLQTVLEGVICQLPLCTGNAVLAAAAECEAAPGAGGAPLRVSDRATVASIVLQSLAAAVAANMASGGSAASAAPGRVLCGAVERVVQRLGAYMRSLAHA